MAKLSVGIDLGTTNTVCCVLKEGQYRYIKFAGEELLTSVLLYQNEKFTFGKAASRKSILNADHYISSAKTFMGDLSKTWEIEDRTFNAEDVACEILKNVRKNIIEQEKLSETDVIEAVITTPAYFTTLSNSRTENAAKKAGFKVNAIITEPVAASIAYKTDLEKPETVYIFDLGGGTFDVSLVAINPHSDQYDVLMVDGDQKLGGDDFNLVILEIIKKEILSKVGIRLSVDSLKELNSDNQYSKVMQQLMMESEKVKITLSSEEKTMIELHNLFKLQDNEYFNLEFPISKIDFEKEAKKLFNRIKKIVDRSLEHEDLKKRTIDRVILVGGSSKIPYITQMIEDIFKKKPYSDRDLSKIVAMGAAIRAASPGIVVDNLIAHSLGIEVIGDKFSKIIEKNSKCPVKQTKSFTTTVDYQKTLKIAVYEGENEDDIKKNDLYDHFILQDIEIAKKGEPNIDVTFSINQNRILEVTAKDTRTNSEKKVEFSLKN